MKERKPITNALMNELFRCDYHILWIYVHDNMERGVYEVNLKLTDGFCYELDIDMFDFDEKDVVYALRELVARVYGGSGE